MNSLKENKMGKVHTTMRGKELDMEKLSLRNELTPAVGNVRVNALGDEIGEGGKIVKTKEQILAEYYQRNAKKADSE
jgi:hypothetical protein